MRPKVNVLSDNARDTKTPRLETPPDRLLLHLRFDLDTSSCSLCDIPSEWLAIYSMCPSSSSSSVSCMPARLAKSDARTQERRSRPQLSSRSYCPLWSSS